ncbi:hypothetical protein [Solidesulfovibrio sp.]
MRLRIAVASLAILALAFAAKAQAQAQDTRIPQLTGTWAATAFHMHSQKAGFTTGQGEKATLVVTEQQGRVFHGEVTWSGKVSGKDTFSGVIDKNGDDFYFVGHSDALRLGKLEGPDAMVFYYLSPGGNNPRAGYVEYRRVK